MKKILLNSKDDLKSAIRFFGDKYKHDIERVLISQTYPCILTGHYIEFGDRYSFKTSQQRESSHIFHERYLTNGIAFLLKKKKKLGDHPESKLVLETTQKLKDWILKNFEVKKI